MSLQAYRQVWPHKLFIMAIDCIANIQSLSQISSSCFMCESKTFPRRRRESTAIIHTWRLALKPTVYDLRATFRLAYLYHRGFFQRSDHLLAFACFCIPSARAVPRGTGELGHARPKKSWANLQKNRIKWIYAFLLSRGNKANVISASLTSLWLLEKYFTLGLTSRHHFP